MENEAIKKIRKIRASLEKQKELLKADRQEQLELQTRELENAKKIFED